jgi:hypothetical protein
VETLGEFLTQLPILYDFSSNTLHRDIQYHPEFLFDHEQPERIETCVQALEEQKQDGECRIDLVDVADASSSENVHRLFSQVEFDHARDILVQAHSEEMA